MPFPRDLKFCIGIMFLPAVIGIAAALALGPCRTACTRTVNISGEWHFFRGGRFTLAQDGKNITGTGYLVTDNLPTATSDPHIPITAQGKIRRERILLTLETGTDTLKDVEFLPSISPKGSQRFLKCPQHLGLTLIPEGVDAFKHDILKPELAELEKKRESSQQPDAVTQEPARSAAP